MKRAALAALVVLSALVLPASAQPRLAPPVKDLPRAKSTPTPAPVVAEIAEPEPVPFPPYDGPCDRREWVRLTTLLLSKPPEPTIFECRPSTAWLVCQWVAIQNGNGQRMLNIVADLESLNKVCRKEGFGRPQP